MTTELMRELPERTCDVLTRWSLETPNAVALIDATHSWTYDQLSSAVFEAVNWLSTMGIRPGDRVQLVFENSRQFVALFFALAHLDAWPILVNARSSAREVDLIREHCQARRVVYTIAVSIPAREHAKRHGASIHQVSATFGDLAVSAINHNAQPEELSPIRADRIAAVIYTSGSSGLPKGVMLSHRNLLFVAATSSKIRKLTAEDCLFGVLPMSHAVGLSVVLLGSLLCGANVYLVTRFDPVATLLALEKMRITILLGAPSMFSLLADYAKLRHLTTLNLGSLRVISTSGAPLSPAVKKQVEQLFGMPLYNNYGVTECSPNISQSLLGEQRSDLSVGKVIPGVQVRIVGPGEVQARDGEVGELRVRGPNVMKGYYRAPEETSAAFDADGWFNTRDLATIENDYLYIVGRTKELIVRFGHNVYPAEVEAVLQAHPSVVRAAVLGQAAEETSGGEEIMAYVQLLPGSAETAETLSRYAATHLAPYKCPSHIHILDAIPLTPNGKIIKAQLAAYASH